MPITYYTEEDLEEAKNYCFLRGQQAEYSAIFNKLYLLRKFSGKRREKEIETRMGILAEMEIDPKKPSIKAIQLLIELALLFRAKRKKR